MSVKILVIDDHDIVHAVLREMLAAPGREISGATTASGQLRTCTLV